jgi:sulfane dehydrogenase subunit SoxC
MREKYPIFPAGGAFMARTSNGDRRRFLQHTAAIGATFGGVVVAPRAVAQEFPLAVPPWSTTPGLPLSEGNYGTPSPFEKSVVRRGRKDYRMPGSGSIMSPLGNLRGTITPNGLVFERSHGGVPKSIPRNIG